jgi:hypothetical protein
MERNPDMTAASEMTWSRAAQFARLATLGAATALVALPSFGDVLSPIGASVPGISSQALPTQPGDSVSGVTQALPANQAMSCGIGLVLSGGSCVPISTLLPPAPTCSYGQVLTGGVCAPINGFTPPPTNCASGTVLSGGSCVPLASAPTPGCATSPPIAQSLPCAAGYTGGITQSRTGSCNAATGYSWNMNAWTTVSNTCTLVPSPVVVQPPPTPSPVSCNYSGVGSWGGGCSGYASVSAIPGQTARIINSAAGFSSQSYAQYTCQSNGQWAPSGEQCTANAPPPVTCSANGVVSWGAGCSAYVSTTVNAGQSTTVQNTAAGYTKDTASTATYTCGSNGQWALAAANCQFSAPPPPPPIPDSWTMGAIGATGSVNKTFNTFFICTTAVAVQAQVNSDGTINVTSGYGSCVAPRPYMDNPASCDSGYGSRSDFAYRATVYKGMTVDVVQTNPDYSCQQGR